MSVETGPRNPVVHTSESSADTSTSSLSPEHQARLEDIQRALEADREPASQSESSPAEEAQMEYPNHLGEPFQDTPGEQLELFETPAENENKNFGGPAEMPDDVDTLYGAGPVENSPVTVEAPQELQSIYQLNEELQNEEKAKAQPAEQPVLPQNIYELGEELSKEAGESTPETAPESTNESTPVSATPEQTPSASRVANWEAPGAERRSKAEEDTRKEMGELSEDAKVDAIIRLMKQVSRMQEELSRNAEMMRQSAAEIGSDDDPRSKRKKRRLGRKALRGALNWFGEDARDTRRKSKRDKQMASHQAKLDKLKKVEKDENINKWLRAEREFKAQQFRATNSHAELARRQRRSEGGNR